MPKHEIKVSAKCTNVDPLVARFSLDDHEDIAFGKRIDLPAKLVQRMCRPDGFDPALHEVTADVVITVKVGKK